ncbi:Peptidyl-prolyl isomerase CWC27 [Paramyrothecium foliicola]|nr:Peptidyl-prolyl isomerase CWC27 [Paramyrothecium foliicola]
MSAIYNLEPQPTASAILHTSLGEISIELFAKQTPLTCRNFLQLALDGYYDNTIFHRLVPNFILQGGDPTGTGNGGESIYDGGAFAGDLDPWPMDQRLGKNAGPTGVNFKDEFHSRLKFNRRGLLAMANEGRPDTNGSQFFFTLDKTEELNGKNTMFGRVAGDTIYNLAKIGELEVDPATERPLYPVKLLRIEILVNPFEDMEKRTRVATQIPSTSQQDKPKKKRKKGGKQLLSFGDEEGDEPEPVIKKAKFDTRIVMADESEDAAPKSKAAKGKSTKREASPVASVNAKPPTRPETESEEREIVPPKPVEKPHAQRRKDKVDVGSKEYSDDEVDSKPREKSALEKANEEIAALKASLRRTVHTEKVAPEKPKSALESMIPETSIRGRKRRPGAHNGTTAEDQKSLRMLQEFRAKLDGAPPAKDAGPSTTVAAQGDKAEQGGDGEAELCDLHFIANCQSCTAWDKQDKEESDDEGWMSHSLSFAAEKIGKDLSNRRKAEEELVVIDPREKARNMKEDKRSKRDSRDNRAWDQRRDQMRNAELARAASIAGRGAK